MDECTHYTVILLLIALAILILVILNHFRQMPPQTNINHCSKQGGAQVGFIKCLEHAEKLHCNVGKLIPPVNFG